MTPPAAKTRLRPVGYDIRLLFPVLFLVGIGIVMVYSASSALALKKYGSDYYFLKKQALFSLVGIVALVICRHIPYRLYRSLPYLLLALALTLLGAIKFSEFGLSAGGSARWLRLGPLSFQPSEFARFALIIYLAYSLSKKMDQIKDFYIGFVPHVVVLGIFTALIILQPDFGSAAILWGLTWIMLFAGGVRILHLLSPLVVIAPLGYLFMVSEPYRVQRLISFWNPWKYASSQGYQAIHSLLAFGTGGIWGTGIGKGYQKLFYLPEPHTDFIFSVIGEELGLMGVTITIILYALILWRGIGIARNAPDAFGALIALGLTSAMAIQVCINMGVALGLLPTKGLTLPFLSYGGTSLLMSMASVGVLLNISAATGSKPVRGRR